MGSTCRKAVFLDRDGVLVADRGPLHSHAQIQIFEDVPQALCMLRDADFMLIGVSNQTVVARGLLDEAGARALQQEIEDRIEARGGPRLDDFYLCPHHPAATLPDYRTDCGCRKPGTGMLEAASRDHGLDLQGCFMVGDRPSDVAAGQRAGCTSVWLHTGRHLDAPIVTSDPFEAPPAEHEAHSLGDAARWICREVQA